MTQEIFNTHKFFYTLNHEERIKGKTIKFLDKNNQEKKIEIEKIEIGTSPVSFRVFDTKNTRHIIPFLRVQEVYDEQNKLVWDSKDVDLTNVKIIQTEKISRQK